VKFFFFFFFSFVSLKIFSTDVSFSCLFCIEEKKKQIQPHLTDPVALKAVYDSEVCVDEYANPRSTYKLLRYVPSARSFLLCRQVRNLAAALANPANQSEPPHDIRHMVGINLKKLLPPTCPQAKASDPVLPGECKSKRKGLSKGDSSRPETVIIPKTAPAQAVLPGVDTLPSNDETDVEMVGPFVPGISSAPSTGLALVWASSLETLGERVRTDATVLRTGRSESNTATALCEVARLPGDMVVWRQSTNQEVVNNLRKGLMMVSLAFFKLFLSFAFRVLDLIKKFYCRPSKVPTSWVTDSSVKLLSWRTP
jgi:hypothetical protein